MLRRERGFEPTRAQSILREYRVIPPRVVGAIANDTDEAMRADAAHGLQFWDAMRRATARRARCRLILTEDFADGHNLEGVTFVDPFEPENARLLDLALPSIDGSSP